MQSLNILNLATQIGLLQIVTGEIIVAKYQRKAGTNGDDFLLTKPAVLMLQQHATGPNAAQVRISFIPYGNIPGVLPAFEEVLIQGCHVVMPPRAIPKQFEDGYLGAVSGIALG